MKTHKKLKRKIVMIVTRRTKIARTMIYMLRRMDIIRKQREMEIVKGILAHIESFYNFLLLAVMDPPHKAIQLLSLLYQRFLLRHVPFSIFIISFLLNIIIDTWFVSYVMDRLFHLILGCF